MFNYGPQGQLLSLSALLFWMWSYHVHMHGDGNLTDTRVHVHCMRILYGDHGRLQATVRDGIHGIGCRVVCALECRSLFLKTSWKLFILCHILYEHCMKHLATSLRFLLKFRTKRHHVWSRPCLTARLPNRLPTHHPPLCLPSCLRVWPINWLNNQLTSTKWPNDWPRDWLAE